MDEFYKLLEIYMIRALGKSRAKGITTLWKLSQEVYNESRKPKDIIKGIKDLLKEKFGNEVFESQLGGNNVYKYYLVVKYILANYEEYLRRKSGCDSHIDPINLVIERCSSLGKPYYEIEHIVCQEKGQSDKRYRDYIHKLGNLTLCSYEWNEKYFRNKDFEGKKNGIRVPQNGRNITVSYAKSDLHIQKELSKYEKFGSDQIQQRTQKLISFAKKRWDFSK
ncbi:MAG: HNH endonuclease family protein [Candidatus Njordarchaeia archaeon]